MHTTYCSTYYSEQRPATPSLQSTIPSLFPHPLEITQIGVMTGSEAQTLTALAEQHRALVEEAAEALPHHFSQCTYSLGSIRQAVYLCLTCAEPRGICSACSIACHTDHEQLELFPKRSFRCDCPTRALSHACTLHPTLEEANTGNHYGQNFRGVFCRCGRPYDARRERETMIQCLACEVRSCVSLRMSAHPGTRTGSTSRV